MPTPNPNTITAGEYQFAIEVDLMSETNGRQGGIGLHASGLHKMTDVSFDKVVSSAEPEEYSPQEVVARGLSALGIPTAYEEAALHRTQFATLVWRAASLAVACHVDLDEAFGYTFSAGSFGGAIAQFDRAVADASEHASPQISGMFGWSLTIGQDTIEVYDGVRRDFMDTADRALKMKRPPRAEALTAATGRLLYATSWILQRRLDSSLAVTICKDFQHAR